ncbi:aminoglycoside phosphotransferase family protein [Nonomuraea terrae]|uniref:aminoglycoside phosphotransferase family protein n=1 Tax=Nonomuraea terrae TaxID=2530383 RepID=UPI0037A6C31C
MYVEPAGPQPEIPLAGGDVTEGVVRVGDTVRRPVGPNAPLVHALLRHLEDVGFAGAPRFLGIDAAGRPRPEWLADEGRLASVGRLVRAYDDAVAGFVMPEGVRPDLGFSPPPGMPPEPPYPAEVVGHMDYTPDNIVFRDGVAAALIDFDVAKSVTRVDEVYNAMLYWAPLSDPADADPTLRDVDVPRRCRILADAYDMSDVDRSRLVEVAVLRTRRSWFSMRRLAEERGGGWARMWQEGVGDLIKRREAWLDRNGPSVHAALTAP